MDITLDEGQIVTARFDGFEVKTDQPVGNGGTNIGPNPYQLFLASLGTCSGFFVKSFCRGRGIPDKGIKLTLNTVNNKDNMLEAVNIEISLPDDFPEKYKKAVLLAADQCKVKKTIDSQPAINVSLA